MRREGGIRGRRKQRRREDAEEEMEGGGGKDGGRWRMRRKWGVGTNKKVGGAERVSWRRTAEADLISITWSHASEKCVQMRRRRCRRKRGGRRGIGGVD